LSSQLPELEAKIEELQLVGNDNELNISEEVTKLRAKSRKLTENIYAKLTPWQVVQVARTSPSTLFPRLYSAHFYRLGRDAWRPSLW
jgi:acetyl-CoA carboxylase alpha subunit